MQTFNHMFAVWILVGFVVVMAGALIYLSRQPKNKGKEIGKIILEVSLKYPISIFFIFLFCLNVAEAGIVASVGNDTINPFARFLTHTTIALISVAAGIGWVKELHTLSGLFRRLGKRDAWFESFGKVWAQSFVVAIATLFTFGLPVANMYIIANGLNQGPQLEIFMSWMWASWGWGSMDTYVLKLANYGLPISYSPWQAMENAMCATFLVTWVHVFLTVWEGLKAVVSDDKDLKEALKNDPTPPKEDKDKDKGKDDKDKDKDKDKGDKDDKDDKKPKDAFKTAMTDILTFMGYSGDNLKNKLAVAQNARAGFSEEVQIQVGEVIGRLMLNVNDFKMKVENKTYKGNEIDKKRKDLQKQITEDLRKKPAEGGLGMTYNAKN